MPRFDRWTTATQHLILMLAPPAAAVVLQYLIPVWQENAAGNTLALAALGYVALVLTPLTRQYGAGARPLPKPSDDEPVKP
jgi:hypothetical protein